MNNNNPKRLQRVKIAQDTLGIIEQGRYQQPQGNVVDLRNNLLVKENLLEAFDTLVSPSQKTHVSLRII